MELVFFSMQSMLCIIILSAASLTPSASLQIQLQPSNQQPPPPAKNVEVSLPPLPRKLRFTEKATVVEQQDSLPYINHNQNAAPSNKKQIFHKQENGTAQNVQTAQVEQVKRSRQEWTPSTEREEEEEEEEDTTVLFTMDYTKVRRRRPIHNKSVSP